MPNARTTEPDALDAALAACAGGDPDAFAPVYDALSPSVFGAALAVLRDRDHAAEVTQEVMVEVWQTAARFDATRGSARTWAVTLTRRRAIDRVRSEQSRRARDQKDLDASTVGAERDVVAEEVERGLDRSAVRDCLDTLTETQRDAVVRAYYGDLTYREVAEGLGAALPTVKSRIRDGLIRLRDCLGVNRG
ncbi:RNA polymerase sigma-70 factor (ECF subfamily) [Sediminihabitans luteus]|uniref:RNA polymerase sigma-70 factor (ECF subfamily) n=1 Tax=Sediminihabitans luteus TaxID=1138585 RepID=A0A2M9CEG9_9CELL|nr:ECF RNA polymerase sigma factor SigK [Sediminihabitans luteus]PJJ70324.1 RNA polymerase sigma-70 factor (ECF subfamily) [Sediminihabitans luteus]GII97795.1 RNA polymerase sigma factor SigK [Sediminihabitans luteus]